MSRLAKAQSRPDATISIARDIGQTLLKLHNVSPRRPVPLLPEKDHKKTFPSQWWRFTKEGK